MRTRWVLFSLLLAACSDGVSDLRVLAKNVVLDPAQAAQRKLAGEEVDTTTVVLAQNVVFENTAASTVTSDNVQGAIEELSIDLKQTLPGTWQIQNKNQESLHTATGQVTISADGTFQLTAGSFAAIGMGSGDFCAHDGQPTYEFFTDQLVAFRHTNQGADNNVIPTVVEIAKDRLVFLGLGGCGELGRQRISILTRL